LPIENSQNAPTKSKHLTARSAVGVCKHFMNNILNKTIVLVLNRNWQAIHVRTPQEAFLHDGHQRGYGAGN
jgi:hypothetical protein